MPSVDELTSELADLAGFLKARAAVGGDATAKDKIMTAMVEAFTKKILNASSFGAPQALALTNALSHTELGDTHRTAIQDAIDTRIGGTMSNAPAGSNGAHTPQKLLSQITCYLTASDWEKIRCERVSLSGKAQVIVDRFQRLGLLYAHEQTVRWAVAILALEVSRSSGNYPSYPCVYDMVQDFKVAMETSRRPHSLGHMVMYPATPADLPEHVYAAAYDSSDPPVSVEIERLQVTAERHVPLRSTSSLLRGSTRRSSPSTGGSSADQQNPLLQQLVALIQGGQGAQQPNIQLLQTAPRRARTSSALALTAHDDQASDGSDPSRFANDVAGVGGDSIALASPGRHALAADAGTPLPHERPAGSSASPDLALQFKPRGRALLALPAPPSAQPAALQNAAMTAGAEGEQPPTPTTADGDEGGKDTAKEGKTEDGGAKPPSARKSTEDYEKAALEALLQRNERKRAERSADSTFKRPAGADTQALKRPAAAIVDGALAWEESDAYKPRDYFTSKIYHRSRKAAKAEGMSDGDSLAVARAAAKQAGEFYDRKVRG